VVALTAPEYRLAAVSRTFHGRDVFAPAAAYLAAGVPLERLGPPVSDPVRLEIPGSRLEAGALVGEVLDVDRFGNLLTSIEGDRLEALPGRGAPRVEVAGRAVRAPVEASADGPRDEAAAIVGSTGRIEGFVRAGSAERLLGVGRGAPVRLRRD
jgi:S-adenosylmethionine hydrolase